MPVLDRLPRLAELALGGARRAASAGASAARDLAEDVRRRRQAQDRATAARAAAPSAPSASAASTDSDPPTEPEPEPAAEAAPQAEPPPPPPADAHSPPDHVDREAVVVAESADPGATGAVGAQITVGEPWNGYDELRAEEVVAQLEDASAETLAVVRLYEQTQRDRRTVVDAIDRRLAAIDE
jgi:hypothetical protein